MQHQEDSQNVRTVKDLNKPQEGSQTQKQGKVPIYLGINLESDTQFREKLTTAFTNVFKQAGEPKQLMTDFENMVKNSSPIGSWKFPASYHVTTLFIGGNKQKMRLPQFEFHQEGK